MLWGNIVHESEKALDEAGIKYKKSDWGNGWDIAWYIDDGLKPEDPEHEKNVSAARRTLKAALKPLWGG